MSGDHTIRQIEEWVPRPEEWYQATVTRVNNGFGFAVLSNDDDVFFSSKQMIRREDGHRCARAEDELAVRLEKNEGSGTKWKAIEAYNYAPSRHQDPVHAIVLRWESHWGVVQRICGCRLLVEPVSVIEEIILSAGDPVTVSEIVENPRAHDGYSARRIKKIELGR